MELFIKIVYGLWGVGLIVVSLALADVMKDQGRTNMRIVLYTLAATVAICLPTILLRS